MTSIPLVSRTRATFLRAEFGFFGVEMKTRMQTPRLWGQPWRAGLSVLDPVLSRPFRTNWLNVGKSKPLFLAQKRSQNHLSAFDPTGNPEADRPAGQPAECSNHDATLSRVLNTKGMGGTGERRGWGSGDPTTCPSHLHISPVSMSPFLHQLSVSKTGQRAAIVALPPMARPPRPGTASPARGPLREAPAAARGAGPRESRPPGESRVRSRRG